MRGRAAFHSGGSTAYRARSATHPTSECRTCGTRSADAFRRRVPQTRSADAFRRRVPQTRSADAFRRRVPQTRPADASRRRVPQTRPADASRRRVPQTRPADASRRRVPQTRPADASRRRVPQTRPADASRRRVPQTRPADASRRRVPQTRPADASRRRVPQTRPADASRRRVPQTRPADASRSSGMRVWNDVRGGESAIGRDGIPVRCGRSRVRVERSTPTGRRGYVRGPGARARYRGSAGRRRRERGRRPRAAPLGSEKAPLRARRFGRGRHDAVVAAVTPDGGPAGLRIPGRTPNVAACRVRLSEGPARVRRPLVASGGNTGYQTSHKQSFMTRNMGPRTTRSRHCEIARAATGAPQTRSQVVTSIAHAAVRAATTPAFSRPFGLPCRRSPLCPPVPGLPRTAPARRV